MNYSVHRSLWLSLVLCSGVMAGFVEVKKLPFVLIKIKGVPKHNLIQFTNRLYKKEGRIYKFLKSKETSGSHEDKQFFPSSPYLYLTKSKNERNDRIRPSEEFKRERGGGNVNLRSKWLRDFVIRPTNKNSKISFRTQPVREGRSRFRPSDRFTPKTIINSPITRRQKNFQITQAKLTSNKHIKPDIDQQSSVPTFSITRKPKRLENNYFRPSAKGIPSTVVLLRSDDSGSTFDDSSEESTPGSRKAKSKHSKSSYSYITGELRPFPNKFLNFDEDGEKNRPSVKVTPGTVVLTIPDDSGSSTFDNSSEESTLGGRKPKSKHPQSGQSYTTGELRPFLNNFHNFIRDDEKYRPSAKVTPGTVVLTIPDGSGNTFDDSSEESTSGGMKPKSKQLKSSYSYVTEELKQFPDTRVTGVKSPNFIENGEKYQPPTKVTPGTVVLTIPDDSGSKPTLDSSSEESTFGGRNPKSKHPQSSYSYITGELRQIPDKFPNFIQDKHYPMRGYDISNFFVNFPTFGFLNVDTNHL